MTLRLIKHLTLKFFPAGNPGETDFVRVSMAITVVAFDPLIHQKVRYREQLYAVLLQDPDFFLMPPDADIPIYFVSHDKILLRQESNGRFTVKKKELTLVEPHIIE